MCIRFTFGNVSMRFTALIMKHTIFLAVMCSLKIGINILNECAACNCSWNLENEDCKFLQNVCVCVNLHSITPQKTVILFGWWRGEGVLSWRNQVIDQWLQSPHWLWRWGNVMSLSTFISSSVMIAWEDCSALICYENFKYYILWHPHCRVET
jgi:hypothetical protein